MSIEDDVRQAMSLYLSKPKANRTDPVAGSYLPGSLQNSQASSPAAWSAQAELRPGSGVEDAVRRAFALHIPESVTDANGSNFWQNSQASSPMPGGMSALTEPRRDRGAADDVRRAMEFHLPGSVTDANGAGLLPKAQAQGATQMQPVNVYAPPGTEPAKVYALPENEPVKMYPLPDKSADQVRPTAAGHFPKAATGDAHPDFLQNSYPRERVAVGSGSQHAYKGAMDNDAALLNASSNNNNADNPARGMLGVNPYPPSKPPGLSSSPSQQCLAALGVAKADSKALARVNENWATVQRAAAAHGINPNLLAAIAVRETGFKNIAQLGGGEGAGVFQIDLGENPSVTPSQAYNIAAAANFAAAMLSKNKARLAASYPHLTPLQLLQATAASYNFGTRHIHGNPDTIDAGTAGNNYGSNVLNLTTHCFNPY